MTAQTAPRRGFYDRIRSLPLRRKTSNAWLGGVASGVADRFNIDPLLIRAAFIMLAFTGVFITVYLVAWLFLSDQQGQIKLQRATNGDIGAVFLTLLVAAIVFTIPWFDGGIHFAAFALTAAVLWFTLHEKTKSEAPAPAFAANSADNTPGSYAFSAPVSHEETAGQYSATVTQQSPQPYYGVTPAPAPRPPRRPGLPSGITTATLGAAVIAMSVVALTEKASHHPMEKTLLVFATGLAVLGVVTLVGALCGRRTAGLGVIALLSIVITGMIGVFGITASSLKDVSKTLEVGDTTFGSPRWEVDPNDPNGQEFQLNFGDATLVLPDAVLGEESTIKATVVSGSLSIEVPDTAHVEIIATANEITDDVTDQTVTSDFGSRVVTHTIRRGTGDTPLRVVAVVDNGVIDVRQSS